jgi:hypothetical protein
MKLALPLLTIVALTSAWAAPGPAAMARQEPPAAQSLEAEGVAQIVTAAELADWGRLRRDPEALLVAARMLDEVPLRAGSGGDPGVAPVLSASSLRQEAAELRGNRSVDDGVAVTGSRLRQGEESPAVRVEREDLAEPPQPAPGAARQRQPVPTRPAPAAPPPPPPPAPPPPPPPAPMMGVASSPFGEGPVSTVKRLGSRESWSFEIDARGAEILRIAAIGDGDTNVDLTVRDVSGKLLCADGFGDHYPVCTLSPAAPARLRVHVVNRGALWTRVQVLSN